MSKRPLLDVDGWFKSSRSSGGDNCVEVRFLPGRQVALRHSKHRNGIELTFSGRMWNAVLLAAADGAFPDDHSEWQHADTSQRPTAMVRRTSNGEVELTHTDAGANTLTFTNREWFAFIEGAQAGEFTWPQPATVP